MELLPETGYIQAQSSYAVQLKFLPRCVPGGCRAGRLQAAPLLPLTCPTLPTTCTSCVTPKHHSQVSFIVIHQV